MFDLGFSELYYENLICKIDNAISNSNSKDPLVIIDYFREPLNCPSNLDPSLNQVAYCFVAHFLDYEFNLNERLKDRDYCCIHLSVENLIASIFVYKLLDMYANDFRTNYEFNARKFLRCCMLGKNPPDLGQIAFDEYFNVCRDFVVKKFIDFTNQN